MGSALKTPHVSRAVRRRVGAAAALAESLLERRGSALTRRLTPRERAVEIAAALLFACAAGAMAATTDPSGEEVRTAILLVACYALVRRVRFPLGPGLIRPTEVVFVPMLFLTPPLLAPLLVALGAIIGELPELIRRRAHVERVAVVVSDGWYSIGPALVIAALGSTPPSATPWTVLVLALVAQLTCDLVATIAREYLGARISPTELLSVLGLVYLIDALLAPIGYLAVLASETYEYAYLLAIAPGALLGLIARERSGRIAHELALERAFRRSTRALDARADDLRRQARRLQSGEAERVPEDRARLERVLLATTVEALQADAGRLSEVRPDGTLEPRLAIGEGGPEFGAAEDALGTLQGRALAIGIGASHVLTVARTASAFSAVERDLLEHLAAQAAVSIENLRLEELMRRTDAELRAILEGVADAVAAEAPDGRLVYVNAAAAHLLGNSDGLAQALGVAEERLPGRQVLDGGSAEPLLVQHGRRWSRVKASPVRDGANTRLAISIIEDITEIKQAEEAQRLLSEVSRALAGSLVVEETLHEVAQLVARHTGGACVIELDGTEVARAGAGEPAHEIAVGDAGTIRLELVGPTAEALALRVGTAVENARLYRTRAAIAHTLQRSLLPPELPEIPGHETGALYRATGEGIEVGGDFYDVFPTSEREWFAVIGDVCGKGAEAAAVTALARYTIRAAVMRHRSPAGILRWLNAAMLRQRAGRFVTLAVARLQLDEDGTTVTVSCGGHPLPRILRATGLVETIGVPGTLLGTLPEIASEDRDARLAPGDALVLYTDGLTEAGAPRVLTPSQLDTLVAGARRKDAQGIVEYLAANTPGPLRDDLALLAVRVQPLL